MDSKIDSGEREATAGLLKDFAAKPDITVEDVYKISWQRFNSLEGDLDYLIKLNEIFLSNNHKLFKVAPRGLHFYLYKNIFSFAGNYRKLTDPLGGRISFGGQHAEMRKPKFQGFHPNKIARGVNEAIKYILEPDVNDPLDAAIRFYQKFVFVHPFYDGNGRIARLISNIYLAGHNQTITWSEFDSKNTFINKLNWCHRSPSGESFSVLTNYIREYIVSLEDLE